LRYAIDEAREENMPNDTIAKAIKKGTGELGAVNYESAVYEGYGPGGVAFMVECLTDNRSRTAPEIRKIFERGGGQLGATNCVAWMFEQKGNFILAADKIDEDSLMELALDAGADDVVRDGEFFQVTCHPNKYAALKKVLEAKKLETVSAEIAMIPKNTVPLEAEKARKAINLSEAFEENDDVQKVYANFELPEEVLNEMEKKG
jgi:YebC/PmpR family DNA-binding regulatory protein